MYAIIKCGGKQYKVSEGDILDIDYTGKAAKETLEITDVLAINNGELKTGAAVANAKVEAVVVLDGTGVNRAKKVIIYAKKKKKKKKLQKEREALDTYYQYGATTSSDRALLNWDKYMYYFGDICAKFNKDDLQHIKNTNIMARDGSNQARFCSLNGK